MEPVGVKRDAVLRAALNYAASEKGDETDAHYGDQLDHCEDILNEAVRDYAEVI